MPKRGWRTPRLFAATPASLSLRNGLGQRGPRETAHLWFFDAGIEVVAGIVNAYPFTCMPSTVCNAVLKPLLARQGVPNLQAPFDDSVQPNQDIALRTFLFQASQRP